MPSHTRYMFVSYFTSLVPSVSVEQRLKFLSVLARIFFLFFFIFSPLYTPGLVRQQKKLILGAQGGVFCAVQLLALKLCIHSWMNKAELPSPATNWLDQNKLSLQIDFFLSDPLLVLVYLLAAKQNLIFYCLTHRS